MGITATPTRPPTAVTLGRAVDAMARRRAADVDLLLAAIEWAELHPAPVGDIYAGWGEEDLYGEGAIPLAGEGALLVAEFAVVELAVELRWSTDSAKELMGDGLELKYRLPRLFAHVLAGRVPVHQATYVARHTHDLTPVAAAHADRLVSADPRRVGKIRAGRLVDEARLYHDPDRALDDELQALAERKVELLPGRTPLTTDVHLRLDPTTRGPSTPPSPAEPPPSSSWVTSTPSTYAAPARSACSPTRSAPSICSPVAIPAAPRRPRPSCCTWTPTSSTASPPTPRPTPRPGRSW